MGGVTESGYPGLRRRNEKGQSRTCHQNEQETAHGGNLWQKRMQGDQYADYRNDDKQFHERKSALFSIGIHARSVHFRRYVDIHENALPGGSRWPARRFRRDSAGAMI